MPYCDAICCDELELDCQEGALNEGERTTGADRCLDEIPNEVADEFVTGFNEVERSARQGECQSADELPAKSRRITTCHNIPAPGVFTRQSVPALKYDEKRNYTGSASASGYRKISDVRGHAGTEENTRSNPYDMRGHLISSPGNDRCNGFRDAAIADSAYSCESASLPQRRSLTDVRPPKTKVKVNCKSSYAVKSRRPCKRRRRAAPVKSACETESSETEGYRTCVSYTSQNFDAILQSVNSCQEVKRISCSQLYRMSRAGQSLAQRSPSFDCNTRNDICDTASSSEDADSRANGTTKSPVANSANICGGIEVPDPAFSGDQDIQRNNKNSAASLHRNEDDVHRAEILPSSKGVNPDDQTETAALVTQVIRETSPKELGSDPVDLVATHQSEDCVDIVSSCELLLQKRAVSGSSGVECHEASEYGRELRNSNAKTKLVANDGSRPTAPSSFEYTDNTASSPSISFSLPTTGAISDAFLEVLSSRLLNAIAKKQCQSQSGGFEGSCDETDSEQQMTFAKKSTTTGVAAGSAAVQPDVVKPTAMNSYCAGAPQSSVQGGPFDCSVYDKLAHGSTYQAAGRTHGIEGYLRRSEAADDCSKWTRPLDGAAVLHAKQALDELRTTGKGAATGHEVIYCYCFTPPSL